MALAEDEAIPLGVVGTFRVDVEDCSEEGGEDVDGREVATDVPEPGAPDHVQVGQPHPAGEISDRLKGGVTTQVGQPSSSGGEVLGSRLIRCKHGIPLYE